MRLAIQQSTLVHTLHADTTAAALSACALQLMLVLMLMLVLAFLLVLLVLLVLPARGADALAHGTQVQAGSAQDRLRLLQLRARSSSPYCWLPQPCVAYGARLVAHRMHAAKNLTQPGLPMLAPLDEDIRGGAAGSPDTSIKIQLATYELGRGASEEAHA